MTHSNRATRSITTVRAQERVDAWVVNNFALSTQVFTNTLTAVTVI